MSEYFQISSRLEVLKRWLSCSVLVLGMCALGLANIVTSAQADDDDDDDGGICTVANFDGQYGALFFGFGPANPCDESTPIGLDTYSVVTAVLFADGEGDARGQIYPNPPGTPIGAPDGTAVDFISPVVIREDCTGFAEVEFPGFCGEGVVVFNVAFVLADIRNGIAHKVLFNQNTGNFRASGELTRIRNADDD